MRRLHPLVVFLVALVACSPSELPPARVCTPGAQVACACPGGAQGAQACNASGDGYGACACPDGAVAGDVGAVVDVLRSSGDVSTGDVAVILDAGGDAVADIGPALSDVLGATDTTNATDTGGDASPSEVRCASPLTACAGTCTDTRADDANCGACGRACESGRLCNEGACSPRVCSAATPSLACFCPNGRRGTRWCRFGSFSDCECPDPNPCFNSGRVCAPDAGCTDLRSDPLNCGACGVVCPVGQFCRELGGGSCRPNECDPNGVTLRCYCPSGTESTHFCVGGRWSPCRCGDAGL